VAPPEGQVGLEFEGLAVEFGAGRDVEHVGFEEGMFAALAGAKRPS
jgi:hypothetical protein